MERCLRSISVGSNRGETRKHIRFRLIGEAGSDFLHDFAEIAAGANNLAFQGKNPVLTEKLLSCFPLCSFCLE
jgi:hypothetical protein